MRGIDKELMEPQTGRKPQGASVPQESSVPRPAQDERVARAAQATRVRTARAVRARTHATNRVKSRATAALRTIAAAATIAGLAFLCSACSGGVSDVAAAGNTTAGLGPYVEATGGELHIYTWAGYMPDDVIDAFEQDTGISLTVDTFDSNEALEAKLQSTGGAGYDIVMPSDYMVEQLAQEGLLMQFDATSLPNYHNIKEQFRKPYYDPQNLYSIPYIVSYTGIVYDSATIPAEDAPTSWADFFHPKASWGKEQVLDDQIETVNAALRATGSDQCPTDPQDYQKASDLLESFKPNVGVLSSEGVADRLASGEQKVGMAWSYDAYQAIATNPNMKFVFPTDGANMFVDNAAISSGATNIDQAKTFLNWMLDPANKTAVEQNAGAGSVLNGGDDLLPDDMKSINVIVPSDEERLHAIMEKHCSNKLNDNYTQMFEDFRS